MLVVDPKYRGQGIGPALMQECVRRAKRDQADLLALHSSPIMSAALAMYREMGFVFHRDGTPVFAVPTAVYVMQFIPEDSLKTLVCLHARAPECDTAVAREGARHARGIRSICPADRARAIPGSRRLASVAFVGGGSHHHLSAFIADLAEQTPHGLLYLMQAPFGLTPLLDLHCRTGGAHCLQGLMRFLQHVNSS
jgi:hypothetical protein